MRIPMTRRGWLALKRELRDLRMERPKLAQEILEAREHGDLSENAEYHAAKERQSFLEGRISDLEAKIAQANVIDLSNLSGDLVVFGATVVVEDVEGGIKSTYQIVGADEADVKRGLISVNSPVARALLRHGVGDEVEVKAPGKTRVLSIIEISFE